MSSRARKSEYLVASMIDEILIKNGHAPLTRTASPPVTALTSDAAAELETYLSEVAATHAEVASRARREYLDALRRLAPRRTGPAPAPGSHALTDELTGPPPAKEALAALLEAVGKSPEDLRTDLAVLARLRDQADLLAAQPAVLEGSRELDREIDAVEAEYQRVLAELAGRRGALELEQRSCELSMDRAVDAWNELCWAQHLEEEIAHAWHHRPHAACLVPDSKADQARSAWHEAFKEVKDRLHTASPRLEYLGRVFFPPPPLPDEPQAEQPIEWATGVRLDPAIDEDDDA